MAAPAVAPAAAPAAAPVGGGDQYLSSVSDESLEVISHFGTEAPALLNRYACTVEDALLQQAQQSTEALQQLQQLGQNLQQMELVLNATLEDNQAYNLLVTEPELLADYVNDFFGPNGVSPVELPEDRLAADVAAAGYAPQQSQQQQPAYQRPQMEMPSPGVQAGGGAGDFWSTFEQITRTQPDQAWRLLSQAPADALRAKALVSEAPPM
jgi:hypothetical protein